MQIYSFWLLLASLEMMRINKAKIKYSSVEIIVVPHSRRPNTQALNAPGFITSSLLIQSMLNVYLYAWQLRGLNL